MNKLIEDKSDKIEKTLIWERYDSEKSFKRPTSREGFCFQYMPDKQKYILFGGISHIRYSDVYTLSSFDWKWNNEKCTGELPKELCYCACWYDAPNFFISGGRTKEIAIQDTYILDTNKWIWYKAFTLDPIDPRFHHAAVCVPGASEAYIFGGYGQKQNKCLNDIKYIKLLAQDKDKVSGASWKSDIKQMGTIPSPRMGHQMIVHEKTIILHGGCNEDSLIEDDKIYQFKIDFKMWSVINITGVKPGARIYHSMGLLKSKQLILFGGKHSQNNDKDYTVSNDFFILDLIDKNSSSQFVAGIGPSNRFGHKCAFNGSVDNSEHVIIGGLDNVYCSMEIFVLKEIELTNDKKWIYEQKNQNTGETAEDKDPIFEIAKQALITYKSQLESLELKNLEVNKKYSELFNMLNNYRRKELEENQTTNLKKNELKDKLQMIDVEQKQLDNTYNQLRDYNNYYNQYLEVQRARCLLIYEYLVDSLDAIVEMDNIVSDIDKSDFKKLLFSNVDIDSLVFKRKNFKLELDAFKMFFKDVSILENSLYEEICRLENENNDKYKEFYLVKSDEKKSLNFANVMKILEDTDLVEE